MVNALRGFEKLIEKCLEVCNDLKQEEAVFFRDNILLQAKLHLSGCKGFISLCKSFFEFEKGIIRLPLYMPHSQYGIIAKAWMQWLRANTGSGKTSTGQTG